MMRPRLPRSRPGRLALLATALGAAVALVLWRLDVVVITDAFSLVTWEWVAVAVVLNLASVLVRSVAWKIVVDQAIPPPPPRRRTVFAAFSIGLLGNAALPGRAGELARVIVLNRRLPHRPGTWATLMGTVFTHRLFDVVVASGLVVFVIYAARIPSWARPTLAIALGIGIGLLVAALVVARRTPRGGLDGLGPVRRLLGLARRGLTVLKRPAPAATALAFQAVGWATQLLAVWAMLYAFEIDLPIEAAALVLVIMNLVMVFPLWPGNVGLVQAAVALSLLTYGVSYGRGFAFGIGVHAVELGVGIALGLLFLAREGFSIAMLRQMPELREVEPDQPVERVA
ncbi:MAG TPA: lysylphosphatidylglycerol synthase transmembrane domain-containing protein [Gaiellaceae bacterium]|nr:lysylphosphatidylglycerol synthase transmembrane domain-containing protein [Gaiellaceae bacterium]